MHLRKQSRAAFGLILALQLATSFGAIALLTRMGPAIAKVAEENVESLTAVEKMLAAISGSDAAGSGAREAFFAAGRRAEANVTEAEERPLLRSIAADAEAALGGDQAARERVLSALESLAEVNRQALHQTDREARRLAQAGAWAAVLLALVTFLLVRLIALRADRRFVMPILEIADTLNAAREGDSYRRCSGADASGEIREIADGVNRLLDERDRS